MRCVTLLCHGAGHSGASKGAVHVAVLIPCGTLIRMPALETVIFNGVKYRRYAKSPYFIPGVADTRNGAQALHRDIWRAANSEIPAGHDIHHRDGNPLN